MNVPEHAEEGNPSGWRYYLNVGFRRRWWFVASAVILWAGAMALSFIVSPKYRSETLVLVEPVDVSAQYVTSNIGVDLQQRLQSLTEQTLSRPRLARLIQEFQLYGYAPGQTVSESQIAQMQGDISAEVTKSTNRGDISAFKIGYSGPSPKKAQEVTNRLASLFIDDSVAGQQKASEDTTSFLENQLEDARKELQRQEGILREVRSRNLGQLPEQMPANVQILTGLQDRLQSATASLNQAEQQKIYLASMAAVSNNPSGFAAGEAPGAAPLPIDEQIDRMKADLARMSGHYKQNHPDVVHLKDQIANAEKLKRQMETAAPAVKTGGTNASADTDDRNGRGISPALQTQLKANEREIASRKQEISDLDRQIATYQSRLNVGPVRQQEITEATKNYDQARTHYEALLAKKQQSEMATDLSIRQQNAQFRTVDPASLPQKAYWPNRLKFSGIGFLLGLLIGFLAVVTKETVDARIYGEDDLSNSVTVPVIATVPPLATESELSRQRRLRRIEVAVASGLIALVPAFTFLVYLRS